MKPTSSDIFAAVANASLKHGFAVLVIGGHAVNAYGYVRTTLDADFLICADDFPLVTDVFEDLGYQLRGQSEAFARMDSPDPLALPVDLMLVTRETFRRLEEGGRELMFGATHLNAPQPLHLIALKLHAMKNDNRRQAGKDLVDILQLIRLCGIDPGSLEFGQILERYANSESRALLANALGERG